MDKSTVTRTGSSETLQLKLHLYLCWTATKHAYVLQEKVILVMVQCHNSSVFNVVLPEIMNKSVLPFLMFSFIAVLTLELVLEMVEHVLRVA